MLRSRFIITAYLLASARRWKDLVEFFSLTREITLGQFIITSYLLASSSRWKELVEFFSLIREILSRPTMKITVGKPVDKKEV